MLGFSVRLVLKGCVEARLDLSEGDEEWVLARSQVNSVSIRRKHAGRLMRCARELNLVEEEYPGKTLNHRNDQLRTSPMIMKSETAS